MKTITVPNRSSVTPDAQVLFDSLKKRLGKVPNLYATIGYSAHVLAGFLDFEAAISEESFSPKEKEGIALLVSEINNCKYCLAAHTLLATMKGYTQDEVLALRRGVSPDPKFAAALELTKSIVSNKGDADDRALDGFFSAGYREADLIELIALIAVRIFTNYVYAATLIPVDFPPVEKLQPVHNYPGIY